MTEAEKTSILAWMDMQIKLEEVLEATETYDEELKRCDGRGGRGIHVYGFKGIKKIADAAGTEPLWLQETNFLPAHFYVIYRENKFFALGSDRESVEE